MDLTYTDVFNIITDKDTSCAELEKSLQLDPTKFSAKDIFDLQVNGIYVNRKAIYNRYNDENKKNCNNDENNENNMNLIKVGTKIKIKKNCFIEGTTFNMENTFSDYDLKQLNKMIKVYWEPKIKNFYKTDIEKINNWSWYKKCNDVAYVLLVRKKIIGDVKEGFSFDNVDLEYEIIDLTPYCIDVQTGVTTFGGKWVIQLPPILAKLVKKSEKDIQWEILGDVLINNFTDNPMNTNYYIKSNVRYDFPGNIFTTVDEIKEGNKIGWYFEKIINFNDVIVIKFDEPFKNTKTIGNSKFDPENPDMFDMIGLVDSISVKEQISENNFDVMIVAEGRDFSKLIIEDGAYFYPNAFTVGVRPKFDENQQQTKEELKIEKFNQYFINAKITNNSNSKIDKFFSHRKMAERIWGQIPYLSSKRFIRVNDFIREIIRMLSVINIQIGKKENNILGTTRSSFANEYKIENGELIETGNWDETSIWNYFEVFTDEENQLQKNRVLFDDSVTTQSGSILSFLERLCQKPFVELFADTWFEKYSLIVRQPLLTIDSYLNNLTIEIGDENIISINTKYDDSKAFSWFRLEPIGLFFGDQNLRLIDFPAILLDDFASVFGSKKLEISSNYFGIANIGQKNKDKNGIQDSTYAQAIGDSLMLLQGLSIEPFMKKGTIETYGNRFIKRGMNIYLKDRDMLYYVEEVQQRSSIDIRRTNIKVSRGIKKSDAPLYRNLIVLPDEVTAEQEEKMKKESEQKKEKNEQSNVGHELYKSKLSQIKLNREYFLKLLFKKIYETETL